MNCLALFMFKMLLIGICSSIGNTALFSQELLEFKSTSILLRDTSTTNLTCKKSFNIFSPLS